MRILTFCKDIHVPYDEGELGVVVPWIAYVTRLGIKVDGVDESFDEHHLLYGNFDADELARCSHEIAQKHFLEGIVDIQNLVTYYLSSGDLRLTPQGIAVQDHSHDKELQNTYQLCRNILSPPSIQELGNWWMH